MASSSRKRTLLISLGVLALVGLALFFIGVPQWEKAQERNVAAFLSGLPCKARVDKVEVRLFEDTVTLYNLRMEAYGFTSAIGKAVLRGVNAKALEQTGVVPLAKEAVFFGYSTELLDGPDSEFLSLGMGSAAVDELVLGGISGNAKALFRALAPETSPAEIMDAQASLHFDAVASKGFSAVVGGADEALSELGFAGQAVTLRIGSGEVEDAGVFRSGRNLMRELEYDFGGEAVFSAKTAELQRYRMPKPVWKEALLTDPLGIRKGGFLVEGMVYRDCAVRFKDAGALSIAEIRVDVDFSASNLMFKMRADDILVPFELTARGMEEDAAAFFKETARAKGVDAWRFRLDIEQNTLKKDGDLLDFTFRVTAEEEKLGKAEAGLVFSGKASGAPNRIFPADTGSLAFVSSRLAFEDRGWVDLAALMRRDAWRGGGSAGQARGALADEYRDEQAGLALGFLVRVADGFDAAVERFLRVPGGRLETVLRAEPPMSVLMLARVDIDTWKNFILEAAYTAGQEGAADADRPASTEQAPGQAPDTNAR